MFFDLLPALGPRRPGAAAAGEAAEAAIAVLATVLAFGLGTAGLVDAAATGEAKALAPDDFAAAFATAVELRLTLGCTFSEREATTAALAPAGGKGLAALGVAIGLVFALAKVDAFAETEPALGAGVFAKVFTAAFVAAFGAGFVEGFVAALVAALEAGWVALRVLGLAAGLARDLPGAGFGAALAMALGKGLAAGFDTGFPAGLDAAFLTGTTVGLAAFTFGAAVFPAAALAGGGLMAGFANALTGTFFPAASACDTSFS